MDQRPGWVTRPGVHDQPGWFVDDDQVVVLVKDPQIHRLGLEPAGRRRRQLPAEMIASPEPASRPGGAVIEADVPLRDQPLDVAAAFTGEQAGQVLVESRGIGNDGVLRRLAQARRVRPPRQTVPSSRTATPTVIDESATLKMGQCGTWTKSMTEPLTPRS